MAVNDPAERDERLLRQIAHLENQWQDTKDSESQLMERVRRLNDDREALAECNKDLLAKLEASEKRAHYFARKAEKRLRILRDVMEWDLDIGEDALPDEMREEIQRETLDA